MTNKSPFHSRPGHVHKAHWENTPVRSDAQLSMGERMADIVRSGMGSWGFIMAFLGFMGIWITLNMTVGVFDAYPFILLNLLLSTMGGLQAGILLVAAKRADRVSSEVAGHTNKNTELLLELIEENNKLTAHVNTLTSAVHAHLIELEEDAR